MSSVKVEHGVQMYQLIEPGTEWVHMKSHGVLTIAGHGAWGETDAGPRDGCPPSPLGNGQQQKLQVLKPFFPRQAGQGAGMVVLASASSWDMLHGHHVAVSPASHLPFPGTEHRSLLLPSCARLLPICSSPDKDTLLWGTGVDGERGDPRPLLTHPRPATHPGDMSHVEGRQP